MQPQVTFRGIFPTQPLVDTVWKRARALTSHAPEIERCHVIIERLSGTGAANTRFRVSLLLSGSEPACSSRAPTHTVTAIDVHTALREVFAHARRRFTRPWLLPRSHGTRVGVHD